MGAKNKRQKEAAKQSGRKLEDFVEIFGRKDRVKRSLVSNKEGGCVTRKTVQTRSRSEKREGKAGDRETRKERRKEWRRAESEEEGEIMDRTK